jgi:hypothetical protein
MTLAVLAATLAPAQSPAPRWNVVDAGAVVDGQSDCAAVFQKLLDEAGKAGGGVVGVPAGRYRINSHLSIPANVTLQGVYRVPPTAGPQTVAGHDGSVLLAYAGRGSTDGPPFIRLAGNNAALAGLVVAYPEWRQSDVPPIPYPPCVSSLDTENVGIRDRCVWMRAAAGQFTASACHFVDWDNGAAGSPALQLDAGKAIVQACSFNRSKLHVAVGSNVLSAILAANQAEGGFRVKNLAGKRLQAALNEQQGVDWTEPARRHQ